MNGWFFMISSILLTSDEIIVIVSAFNSDFRFLGEPVLIISPLSKIAISSQRLSASSR
jgi:hypothetical protein